MDEKKGRTGLFYEIFHLILPFEDKNPHRRDVLVQMIDGKYTEER
jgi:hypothetical protein